MLTIYDAEDIPDPLQLRRAVVAFRRAPVDVGCLQARLAYFNERQNLITRWFSMEYDQWFGAILPAVEQSRCVVPLGGTSCHLPTAVWRDIGGWDEYNVTEDADLGVRLARYGYRTLILDSVTLEEANSDVVNSIRQRSRWYKGYMQTLIVHLRRPVQLRREIGLAATLRLINLTGAVPVINAVNLLLWSTMLVWIIARPHAITLMFPPVTYYLCLILLMLATPLSIFAGLVTTVASASGTCGGRRRGARILDDAVDGRTEGVVPVDLPALLLGADSARSDRDAYDRSEHYLTKVIRALMVMLAYATLAGLGRANLPSRRPIPGPLSRAPVPPRRSPGLSSVARTESTSWVPTNSSTPISLSRRGLPPAN